MHQLEFHTLDVDGCPIYKHCKHQTVTDASSIPAGVSMKKKIMAAALNMAEHVVGHDELCSTIPQQSLAVWTQEIEKWEKDSTKPNPFAEIFEGM